MSLEMHEKLKRYILRERRKKIEEDEQNEQKLREEMVICFLAWKKNSGFIFKNYISKQKKVEMNSQTLEQTRNQLKHLEIKLEDLTLVIYV